MSPQIRLLLLRVGIGFPVLYIAFGSYVWWAMHQPPEKFANVVSCMPGPLAFLLSSL